MESNKSSKSKTTRPNIAGSFIATAVRQARAAHRTARYYSRLPSYNREAARAASEARDRRKALIEIARNAKRGIF